MTTIPLINNCDLIVSSFIMILCSFIQHYYEHLLKHYTYIFSFSSMFLNLDKYLLSMFYNIFFVENYFKDLLCNLASLINCVTHINFMKVSNVWIYFMKVTYYQIYYIAIKKTVLLSYNFGSKISSDKHL